MAKAQSKSGTVYCMRIALDEVMPTIWRRVWVEGHISLLNLHHTIQAAMGWTDAHLHQFQIAGLRYATPDPEDDPEHPVIDERRVLLQKALDGVSSFGYLYDFGDGWQHTIAVEQRLPEPQSWRGFAHVEAGENACPPEDAGGPHGYQEFLDKYGKGPRSKAVREFMDWAGKDFDPTRFDRHSANAALLRMAWNRWS